MNEEIKGLRTYNRQVFKGNNASQMVMRLFPADVHYNNKLLEGDGVAGFRKWDLSLRFIDTGIRRGWTFKYHNYQPFIPEYADDWFVYRDLYQGKDQSFAFKPRNVGHILGRLVPNIPNLTDVNAVIYDDAFGVGFDLIIYFTGHKFIKLIRIREGFYPSVNTDFDFIFQFPNGVEVYEKDSDTGTMTQIDPLTPKTLGLRSQIYIGHDMEDGQDWYTRVSPVRIWDSGVKDSPTTGKKINLVPAAIAVVGGATIFRKRVQASFFTDAVGDVYTDATTTYTENKDTYYGTSFTTGGDPNGVSLNIGGWGDFYYSYVEWDLTGSPTSAEATECKASVMVRSTATNDSTSSWRQVTSSWTEAGVTNAAHPTDSATNAVSITNPVTTGVGNRDEKSILTQFYEPWKDGTMSNFGLKIHSATNSNAAHSFYSSDDADSNKYPWLLITYTPTDPYTRENPASLPTTSANLATTYSAGEKTNVATDDATRVGVAGTVGYLIHEFGHYHTDNTSTINITINLQTDKSPASKNVILQVWNNNTSSWETFDTESSASTSTDFNVTASITSSVANYYGTNNLVLCRVYQQIL